MSVVFILWSLVLFAYGIQTYWQSKPFRLWSGKRAYYLFAVCAWALGFLLVGVSDLWEPMKQVAYAVYGASWFLMIFVPCSVPIFNENPTLKMIRAPVFAIVGALQFPQMF